MKKQLIKVLLISGLFLLQGLIYGQNTIGSKTRYKRIKKLKKKYSYVDVNPDCNAAIVGDNIYGGNDGGGRIPMGISNIKIVSLLDKKLKPWTSPYGKAHTMIMDYNNDKGNKRIIDDSNKVGLLNACKKVILKPKYDEIGPFNKNGLAVAILHGKIDVIDLNGKSVLPEPFKYNSIYQHYNRNRIYHNFSRVYKSTLIIRLKDGKYGLLNIKNDKIITDYAYDKINSSPFINHSEPIGYLKYRKIGYLAYRNGKATIVNFLGKEIIKPVFQSILKFKKIDKNIYVIGSLKDRAINIYDNSNISFLIPDNIAKKTIRVKLINKELVMLEINTKKTPKTINYNSNYSKTGIYNITTKKFIIEPRREYKFSNGMIRTDMYGFIIIYLQNYNKSKLFDYKGKLLNNYIKAEYSNFVVTDKKNRSNRFLLVSSKSNPNTSQPVCTMYKRNGEIVFENAEMYPVDIVKKLDYFYIKETINCYPCKKAYTAFDFNGNMIGEKRQFVPNK